ncbi:MAG: SRPBCC family protein [Bacteroidia bacterium]|nr:SRPBCC family protein [Bacteroidia bacterium]
MKILKKILIVLAVLIAIPLIVALFVKKDYAVEREITINKPVQEVFDYVKYIKNQDYYSKWNQLDPGMKKSYTGTDGTPGFISAWESTHENVGVGEQEIIKITEGERIDMKLRFKVPFEAEDDAYMTTTGIDSSSTKVAWGFKGTFPYPMNIMGLIMDMETMIGGDLEVGLNNLKAVLEKQ